MLTNNIPETANEFMTANRKHFPAHSNLTFIGYPVESHLPMMAYNNDKNEIKICLCEVRTLQDGQTYLMANCWLN